MTDRPVPTLDSGDLAGIHYAATHARESGFTRVLVDPAAVIELVERVQRAEGALAKVKPLEREDPIV